MDDTERILAEAAVIEGKLAHIRDGQFADMLVLMIGLAAERQPELLRRALGKVFDLTDIDNSVLRSRQLAKAGEAEVQGIQVIYQDLLRRIADLDARWERLDERITKGARAFSRLAELYHATSNGVATTRGATK